jgi:hypothetical protein
MFQNAECDLTDRGMRNLSDRGMIKIAECCPNMENFNISFCTEITDVSLSKIAESCHNVNVLKTSCCNKISIIMELNVSDCDNVSDESLT